MECNEWQSETRRKSTTIGDAIERVSRHVVLQGGRKEAEKRSAGATPNREIIWALSKSIIFTKKYVY